MITIEINNVFTKWSGDPEIIARVAKAMAFKHPKAYYMQKRLKFNWDGWVRPMTNKGRLPTGLLEKGIEILSEYTDQVIIKDYREQLQWDEIPTTLGKYTLYPYQVQAIEAILTNQVADTWHPRGIIAFSVGAGKTLIMYALYQTLKVPTLIVVDRKVMFEQIKREALELFPESEVGWIAGSKSIKWAPLMVCMVKSLANALEFYQEELNEYKAVLVDEVDAFLGDTIKGVLANLSRAVVRVGFSGSVFIGDKEKKADLVLNTTLRQLYGEPLMKVTTSELSQQGYLTPGIVKIILGNTKPLPYVTLDEEFEHVLASRERAKLIHKRILFNIKVRKVKQIFVFTKYIKQTELLYQYLTELGLPPGYSIDYSHHKRVGNVLEKFKKGELNILVTSLYLKRGVNVPNIEVIINASGGAQIATPIQIFGRGVRKGDKKIFVMEDFLELECKFLTAHSKNRIHLYNTLKIPIKFPASIALKLK